MDKGNSRSFWKRKEGFAGGVFLGLIGFSAAFLIARFGELLIASLSSTLNLVIAIVVVAALLYMFVDPKMRSLIWYMYKSTMRKITSFFVTVDPINILKSYAESLGDNLKKMGKQINQLRAQMHKLNETIYKNNQEIHTNLQLASEAKDKQKEKTMILKSRKAGRLKESNMKLQNLHSKMEVMYRVLSKMFENSEILKEDIEDQVEIKVQERKAIHASHGAMKSAMNIMSGSNDKRMVFEEALEAIAEDVGSKVGEMERFMDLSSNFMDSVDLQSGVFEEKGLKMLEEWETGGVSKILGDEKDNLLIEARDEENILDLNQPIRKPEKSGRANQYDSFFE